ncbi:hypothetical protein AXF42_Ash004239 [Apostasia shenzhenica]|uniref:Myb-like domain-containing protein n=1 Tax=Apostasia shenzhenica TaxID=1088818 RepID=A0A2I0A2D0_9ASPA|nr:hypothetical protein AXF42_Ash004239 [Apostasia shenzhenica]
MVDFTRRMYRRGRSPIRNQLPLICKYDDLKKSRQNDADIRQQNANSGGLESNDRVDAQIDLGLADDDALCHSSLGGPSSNQNIILRQSPPFAIEDHVDNPLLQEGHPCSSCETQPEEIIGLDSLEDNAQVNQCLIWQQSFQGDATSMKAPSDGRFGHEPCDITQKTPTLDSSVNPDENAVPQGSVIPDISNNPNDLHDFKCEKRNDVHDHGAKMERLNSQKNKIFLLERVCDHAAQCQSACEVVARPLEENRQIVITETACSCDGLGDNEQEKANDVHGCGAVQEIGVSKKSKMFSVGIICGSGIATQKQSALEVIESPLNRTARKIIREITCDFDGLDDHEKEKANDVHEVGPEQETRVSRTNKAFFDDMGCGSDSATQTESALEVVKRPLKKTVQRVVQKVTSNLDSLDDHGQEKANDVHGLGADQEIRVSQLNKTVTEGVVSGSESATQKQSILKVIRRPLGRTAQRVLREVTCNLSDLCDHEQEKANDVDNCGVQLKRSTSPTKKRLVKELSGGNHTKKKRSDSVVIERPAKGTKGSAIGGMADHHPKTVAKQHKENLSHSKDRKCKHGHKHSPPKPAACGRRVRLKWSSEEVQMLKEAVKRTPANDDGSFSWTKILEYGSHVFLNTRTTMDLKDKALVHCLELYGADGVRRAADATTRWSRVGASTESGEQLMPVCHHSLEPCWGMTVVHAMGSNPRGLVATMASSLVFLDLKYGKPQSPRTFAAFHVNRDNLQIGWG